MNINEVKKHVTFELVLIICTIICFLLTLYVILFTDIGVKASTSINVTSGITPGQSCSTHTANRYCSLNTCQTGDAGQVWSFGSTNDTCNVMSIQFYLNTTVGGYTANTLKLEGSNFRNTNYYCTSSVGGCSVVFVSTSQLNVNFQNNGASGISNPQFQVNAYNNGYINNGQSWKLSKITYIYNDIGSGQTSTDEIINNQNSNNQEVIENNNANTQTIVNNILQTIDTIKYGMNTCYKNYFNVQNVGYNSTTTGVVERTGNRIKVQTILSNRNDVNSNKKLKDLAPDLVVGSSYRISWTRVDVTNSIYLYGSNISWINGTDRIITQSDLDSYIFFYTSTQPSTGYYDNFMIQSSSGAIATHFVPFGEQCSNKLDTIYDSQNEINNYLQDNSDPSIDTTALNGVLQNVDYNNPLDYLLTLPFHLIQKINTILAQNSCDRISFGQLLGTELYLPCINIQSYLGSSLFNTIDIFMAVGLLAVTLKKFYDSISNIITLGKEKEVKDKLELPTPMEFLSMILGGRD